MTPLTPAGLGLDAALDPDTLPKPIAGKALKGAAAKAKVAQGPRTSREEGELAFAAALGQLMRPAHTPQVDLPGYEGHAKAGAKGLHNQGVKTLTSHGPTHDRPEHVEEALARRAKGHAQDPSAALERRKAAKHEPRDDQKPTPDDTSKNADKPFATLLTEPVNKMTDAPEIAAPPPIADVLPPQALADESLRGAVMAQAAHLHLQTDGLGDLGLHLRVREGVAEVRLDGNAAQALKGHESELREALAAEGVKLGQFTVTAPEASADTSGQSADRHRDQRPPDQTFADARSFSQQGGDGRRQSATAEEREERGSAPLGPPRAKTSIASEESRTVRRMRTGRHHVDA